MSMLFELYGIRRKRERSLTMECLEEMSPFEDSFEVSHGTLEESPDLKSVDSEDLGSFLWGIASRWEDAKEEDDVEALYDCLWS